MKSNIQAIESFKFICDICDRATRCHKCTNNWCGVLIYKEYAIATSNNVMGVARVNDGLPASRPLFYSYRIKEQIREVPEKLKVDDSKYTAETLLTQSDPFLERALLRKNKLHENALRLYIEDFISEIEKSELSHAQLNKLITTIKPRGDKLIVTSIPKKETKSFRHKIKFNVKLNSTLLFEESITINCYTLYATLKKLRVVGNEYVSIAYSEDDMFVRIEEKPNNSAIFIKKEHNFTAK